MPLVTKSNNILKQSKILQHRWWYPINIHKQQPIL
jgi:hypothetical protein